VSAVDPAKPIDCLVKRPPPPFQANLCIRHPDACLLGSGRIWCRNEVVVVLRSDRHEDAAIGNDPFSAWSEIPGRYAALHLLLVHELSRQPRSKRDHDQPFRSVRRDPSSILPSLSSSLNRWWT
jgi:hypothetical protein